MTPRVTCHPEFISGSRNPASPKLRRASKFGMTKYLIKSFIRSISSSSIILTPLFVSLTLVAAIFSIRVNTEPSVIGVESRNESVNVALILGKPWLHFKLYGYSSPKSLISLENIGISNQTTANEEGYFEFNNPILPKITNDLCLISKDQFGRTSTPVCIPAFPEGNNIEVGPVIMPPTISTNTPAVGSDYYLGDEISLSGQTIPETEVNLSIFVDKKKSIVRQVEAYSFPDLKTTSDNKGNFSFSLPNSNAKFFRLFTQTNYNSSRSPKSTTLNIKILPIWMMIVRFFYVLFSLIKSRLLEFIIVCQLIGITIYLLRRYINHYAIIHQKAIIIRNHYDLMKEETDLMLRSAYPLEIT